MTAEKATVERTHYPWLEYLPEGGDRVKKTQLDKDTFTIGRSDTADVPIDSTRVSREHAQIFRKKDKYLIRDLQSTNGTFVNGKRIEEAELSAGDVIVVADTEFAFLMDSVSRLRRMKTQQMTSSRPVSREGDTTAGNRQTQEAVLSLRTVHERLCQGFTHLELTSILELPAGTPFAHLEYFANSSGLLAREQSPLLQPPSHALIRLREVRRFETVKRCVASLDCARIIVPVEPWEIHEIGTLVWHFEAMAAILPRNVLLLASVPASAASDLTEVQKFCSHLQNIGIEICCHDFAGSHAHVDNLAELRPQLLLLASEMSLNLTDKPQTYDRLVSVAESCKKLDIRPVVTGKHDQKSTEELIKLGIDLFLPDDATPSSSSSARDLPREVLAASACH
jgi:FHA domain/EAL domain